MLKTHMATLKDGISKSCLPVLSTSLRLHTHHWMTKVPDSVTHTRWLVVTLDNDATKLALELANYAFVSIIFFTTVKENEGATVHPRNLTV